MKKIIKIVGVISILGTMAVASTPTSSISTMEGLNTKVNTTSMDTSWYCDPIERLMGMCRSSQLPFEN